MAKINTQEHFMVIGSLIVLIIILLSACTIQKDIVGFAVTQSATTCKVDTFATTAACNPRSTTKDLFCPTYVYVQRCFDNNGDPDPKAVEPVLNYCMNGFCGKRVLDMNFEQVSSTSVPDLSGAGNTGGCTSCPSSVSSGRRLKSAQFGGLEAVDIPLLGKYLPPVFTIVGWVKPNKELGTKRGVIIASSEGIDDVKSIVSPGFALSVNGNVATLPGGPNSITFHIADLSAASIAYAGPVITNSWNHVAVVVTEGVAKIYHNGVDVTAVAGQQTKGVNIDSSKPWSIGKFAVKGGGTFMGELDELRVVPRAMTLEEIQKDMASAVVCGNGLLEDAAWRGTEVCDGTDFGGATCASLGFAGGGSLACSSDCKIIGTAGCSNIAVSPGFYAACDKTNTPTGITAPDTVTPGATFTATVTLVNTGTEVWDANAADPNTGDSYFLMLYSNPLNDRTWGLESVGLPRALVQSTETAQFTFTPKAPSVRGVYDFRWQLMAFAYVNNALTNLINSEACSKRINVGLPYDSVCTLNSQCMSDMCISGKCACTSNSNCPTGLVCDGNNYACTLACTTDAGCVSLAGTGCVNGYCAALKPNGAICVAQNECASGYCHSGICQPQIDGGICTSSSQCSSNNCVGGICACTSTSCQSGYVCGTNNICNPIGLCSTNAQCPVGTRCNPSTGNCADVSTLLALGNLCNNYLECQSFFCSSNNYCGDKSNGVKCARGTDCASGSSYCSVGSGQCVQATGGLSSGQACFSSLGCSSGLCYGHCAAKVANAQLCYEDKDCASGFCQDRLCVAQKVNGIACTRNAGCLSSYCEGTPKMCTALKSNSQTCTTDTQCASKYCTNSICTPQKVDGTSSSCDRNAVCLSGNCNGGSCKPKIADNTAGCTSNIQCASNFCDDTGIYSPQVTCRARIADSSQCWVNDECLSENCGGMLCG